MYRSKDTRIDFEKNPDFLNEMLNYYIVVLNSSPSSMKEENIVLRNFLKYIAIKFKQKEENKDMDISELNIDILKKIKKIHIENYIAYLSTVNKNKANTISKKICCIKHLFYYYSEKNKILKENPTKDLKCLRREKSLPIYLSLDDSKKVLSDTYNNDDNKFSIRNYCIVVLFLNLGIRVEELVSIDINDISKNKITILGKGREERVLYLNEICLKAIKKYLEKRIPPEFVKPDEQHSERALFLTIRKTRISVREVQVIIKNAFKQAGLDYKKLSVHKLRHTCATLLYLYGNIDIRTIQKVLGHDNIETTEIYTHINNKYIKELIENSPIV